MRLSGADRSCMLAAQQSCSAAACGAAELPDSTYIHVAVRWEILTVEDIFPVSVSLRRPPQAARWRCDGGVF